jgi:pimeloyl-ACP methyl ester carboxylesterase
MPGFTLETDHGLINITDTALKNEKPALLLLHGNSSSSAQLRHFFDSKNLDTRWRLITFDLPGHGVSTNAPDPEKSYYQRGYANLAVHILQHLNITSVVIFGWSLGGHIGIEMIPLLGQTSSSAHSVQLRGLMIVGTPPTLGKEQIKQGFKFDGQGLGLAGTKNWTDEETEAFARNSAAAGKDECFEPWILDDAQRTDGRARAVMGNRFLGTEGQEPVGVDQRKVVEETDTLIGVVNGAEEQYVDLDYLDEVRWKRLWKGKCVRLEGLKHAPFWEDPKRFEPILIEFLQDCEKQI